MYSATTQDSAAAQPLRRSAPAAARLGTTPGARARRGLIREIGLPILLVTGVLAALIGFRLVEYGGNLTGFIQFGSLTAAATHPPAGALLVSPTGYDGQFFFAQAKDPLILHSETVRALRQAHSGYRLRRAAYPMLAWLAAAGRPGLLPFSLLAVNVGALLALAGGFAVYAARRGWSTLWSLPVALMPGLLLGVSRDLANPVATTALVAGVLLWERRRRWWAAAALVIAVLTREEMMLGVLAVGLEVVARSWTGLRRRRAWRGEALAAWPVVLLPTAAFVAWQVYVSAQWGATPGGPSAGVPGLNLLQEVVNALRIDWAPYGIWNAVYVVLIVAALGAALLSVRERLTLVNVAAVLMAAAVIVPKLATVWGVSRLSTPLFVLVLVDGLRRRHRPSVAVAVAAAAMSLLLPVALPGAL